MKGKSNKIISLCLILTMIVALCACGNSTDNNGGSNSKGNSKVTNSAAKENVYAMKEFNLNFEGENTEIATLSVVEDKVYIVATTYNWTEEGNNTKYFIYQCNLEGTVESEIELEMDSESTNGWLNILQISTDGTVYGIKDEYFEDYSDPDNYIYENYSYLMGWNVDGTINMKKETSEIWGSEGYYYVQNSSIDDNGNLSLILNGDSTMIYQLNSEGDVISKKELDSTSLNSVNQMFPNGDGTFLVTSYNDEWTKMYTSTFDPITATYSEKIELPNNIFNYSFYPGVDSDFILSNNSGVYKYNIGDEEPNMIMNYVNSDLATSYLNYINVIDENNIVASYYDNDNWQVRVALFTYVDPADIPDKEVLVVGCNYINNDIRKEIIRFNKTNAKYRITIRDYSSYNTMDDYNASYTQMNNDIISGQMPDIMLIDTNLSIENYAKKGLLADIRELINQDEELSKNNYLENVWEAFSIDGKLYNVVPTFSINTMVAKTSLVGDRTGWTMEEFIQALTEMPEGIKPFGETIQSSFMYNILNYSGKDFIDIQNSKCYFDTPDFINILEFANTLPKEYANDYWEDYDYSSFQSEYRDNRTLLMNIYISAISDLVYNINGYIGEDVTFIGFPSPDRKGSIISSSNVNMVISAKSSCIEGAWEFARYFLTEEYQNSGEYYGLSVLKSVFEEKAYLATEKPYWTDENGEKIEYDNTFWINDEEMVIEQFTKEQVDQIIEFVYSVDKGYYYNTDVQNIIMEESEAYFSGQKSAEDVAKIIQSRVQIYVDENS